MNPKQKGLVLLLTCLFVLWPFLPLDPAENLSLSPEEQAALSQASYSLLYQEIPVKAVTTQPVVTFKDRALKQVVSSLRENQALAITDLVYREDGLPLFQLKDGSYLLASRRFVYSNQILSRKQGVTEAWLKVGVQFYKEAPLATSQPLQVPYKPYQKIKLVEKRIYPRGDYALTDKGEFVALAFLSEKDNRMERVQQVLEQNDNKDGLAIYVKQLNTGQTAGMKSEMKMYSASITKLPYLYYIQKQVLAGRLRWTDTFTYTKETEDYDGAYDPAGTGSLPKTPDNKPYSVKELEEKAAKESDNVAHNILGYYGTGASNAAFRREIKKIVGQDWDVVEREVSPQMAGQLLEAIYDQGGDLLEMLKQTQFDDQRIPRDLPVPVAHKIGDADAFHHDAAIVWADSPYILVVFTENQDNDLISQISKDIYEVLK